MITINGIKWVQMKLPGIFWELHEKECALYFGNAVSCTLICFCHSFWSGMIILHSRSNPELEVFHYCELNPFSGDLQIPSISYM